MRNPFIASAQMLQLRQVRKRSWLNFNTMVLHGMYVYSETIYVNFCFMMCNCYKKIATPAIQACCFHHTAMGTEVFSASGN